MARRWWECPGGDVWVVVPRPLSQVEVSDAAARCGATLAGVPHGQAAVDLETGQTGWTVEYAPPDLVLPEAVTARFGPAPAAYRLRLGAAAPAPGDDWAGLPLRLAQAGDGALLDATMSKAWAAADGAMSLGRRRRPAAGNAPGVPPGGANHGEARSVPTSDLVAQVAGWPITRVNRVAGWFIVGWWAVTVPAWFVGANVIGRLDAQACRTDLGDCGSRRMIVWLTVCVALLLLGLTLTAIRRAVLDEYRRQLRALALEWRRANPDRRVLPAVFDGVARADELVSFAATTLRLAGAAGLVVGGILLATAYNAGERALLDSAWTIVLAALAALLGSWRLARLARAQAARRARALRATGGRRAAHARNDQQPTRPGAPSPDG